MAGSAVLASSSPGVGTWPGRGSASDMPDTTLRHRRYTGVPQWWASFDAKVMQPLFGIDDLEQYEHYEYEHVGEGEDHSDVEEGSERGSVGRGGVKQEERPADSVVDHPAPRPLSSRMPSESPIADLVVVDAAAQRMPVYSRADEDLGAEPGAVVSSSSPAAGEISGGSEAT